jgi:hypothetical protein
VVVISSVPSMLRFNASAPGFTFDGSRANRLLIPCIVALPFGQHLSKAFTEGKASSAGISLTTDGGALVEFQRTEIFFKDSRSWCTIFSMTMSRWIRL